MIDSALLIRPSAKGKMEFPFGLLYVGAVLKKQGYSVKILDIHAVPDQEPDVEKLLLQNPKMILGISAHSSSYFWVKQLTLNLKKKIPDLIIVIGGHIIPMYRLLLEKTGVDYVCMAEGEITFPVLIQELNKGRSVKNVPGLAFKSNGQIINTGPAPLLKTDQFTIPDFSLLDDVERYFIHPSEDDFFKNHPKYLVRARSDDKVAALMFSRGCTGACSFCYRHLPGYRQGSLEWSWRFLMKLYNDYDVRYFRTTDELFIANKEWFDGFYQKVMDSGIDILFRIRSLRVDMVNDETLAKLKQMGCIAINYGIESGSQKVLDAMNKGVTVAQNRAAIQKTISHGIKMTAFIMFGHEGETKETLEETLDMLLDPSINPTNVSVFYAIPLPGTRLYQNCINKGLIEDEESFMRDLFPAIANQHDRYLIQLGDVTKQELFGFEHKFNFLLSFKTALCKNPFVLKAMKKIVLLIPFNSKANIIFGLGHIFLDKLVRARKILLFWIKKHILYENY